MPKTQCVQLVLLLALSRAFVPVLTQRQKETLSNPNREQLYKIICERPGVRLCELLRISGLKPSVAVYHVTVLGKRKLIKSKKEGKYIRYFKSEVNSNGHPRFVSHVQQKIYDVLVVNGPMSQKEICTEVGCSQQLVSYHLKTFEEDDVVVSSRGDGVTVYGLDGK